MSCINTPRELSDPYIVYRIDTDVFIQKSSFIISFIGLMNETECMMRLLEYTNMELEET